MKPSAAQLRVLVLARDHGYVRPSSRTHARRCETTVHGLGVSALACQRHGWLRLGLDGKLFLTDAGREFAPDEAPRRNDEGWGW